MVCQDVDCIIQGNLSTVKAALLSSGIFQISGSGVALAAGAIFIDYIRPDGQKTPVELLRAGEFGPTKLSSSNTIVKNGIRFLNPTEFLRSKVKAWYNRGASRDRYDIVWMLKNMSDELDLERVNPDGELDDLAEIDREVAELWSELQGEQDPEVVD